MVCPEGKAPVKKEAFIACPVCCSGSRFQLEHLERELVCEICKFVLATNLNSLATNLNSNVSDFEECIFCSSTYFYFEAPLDLSFLGRASICYVCETRYKGTEIDAPDEKYYEHVARVARRSEFALHWKERADEHKHQTDSKPVVVRDTIES